jgi:uncharacterized membrane protein YccC
MSPRLGSALRFAIAVAAVDFSSLVIFHSAVATTASSFATIGSLYFLDYDGRARSRLGAYAVSTGVAIVGLLLGAFVQGNLVATAVVAVIVGFSFAAARAFKGLVARSFIGTQLAFVLAIFVTDASAHVSELLAGWLWGALLSTVAALTIFPRHTSGELRSLLSNWCAAVAEFVRADASNRPDALTQVNRAVEELDKLNRGDMIAGLWSRRTRALAAMTLHVHQMTEFMSLIPPASLTRPFQAQLAEVTAAGFDAAAAMVVLRGKRHELAPVPQARIAEYEGARAATASMSDQDAQAELSERFNLRVLSIGAESAQVLAAASQGWPHQEWPLLIEPEHSIPSLIKRTFTKNSVWLFHGIRTAVALAASVVIATLMGLEHGVWVVMTTLSVINVSFTTSGSSRNALNAVGGVLVGITGSAIILAFTHQWWILAVAVPVMALTARWFLPTNAFLAQMTYSPFAVLNVALLGWPTPRGLDIVRFEDILVGVSVAIVATALTFPFGLRRLLESTWHEARTAANAALQAARKSISTGEAIPAHLARAQALTFAEATDAVDTVYTGGVQLGERAIKIEQRQRWLNLALLCQIGVEHLAELRRKLADGDPGVRVLTAWSQDAFAVLDQADVREKV